jgi:hypothetical protein
VGPIKPYYDPVLYWEMGKQLAWTLVKTGTKVPFYLLVTNKSNKKFQCGSCHAGKNMKEKQHSRRQWKIVCCALVYTVYTLESGDVG